MSIEDIVPLIKEQLNYNGTVRFTPKGNSMLPTLRNNKDSVTLKSPLFPLKKYDIAFYVRDNGRMYYIELLIYQKTEPTQCVVIISLSTKRYHSGTDNWNCGTLFKKR